MTNRSVEEIVCEIAGMVVSIDSGRSTRYFFYIEFDDGVSAPSLFREEENNLVFLNDRATWELEFELNEIVDPQPIGALLLDIEGDGFKASFEYGIKVDENTHTRSIAAVKERFGDKPIIYPNLPRPRADS